MFVPTAHDQGNLVENRTVNLYLMRKSLQRIHIALQLKSMKDSIHNGNINSRSAMPQAELVQNPSFGVTSVTL